MVDRLPAQARSVSQVTVIGPTVDVSRLTQDTVAGAAPARASPAFAATVAATPHPRTPPPNRGGVNGPVVVFLAAPESGSSSGCTLVDHHVAKAILKTSEHHYINVRNADFSAGAARGQSVQAAATTTASRPTRAGAPTRCGQRAAPVKGQVALP